MREGLRGALLHLAECSVVFKHIGFAYTKDQSWVWCALDCGTPRQLETKAYAYGACKKHADMYWV